MIKEAFIKGFIKQAYAKGCYLDEPKNSSLLNNLTTDYSSCPECKKTSPNTSKARKGREDDEILIQCGACHKIFTKKEWAKV